MQKPTRFKKYQVSFIALLILGASIFPTTAHATAPTVGACSDTPDYTTALEADSRYDPDTIGFIVFQREWGGAYLYGGTGLAVNWTGTIGVYDVDSTHVGFGLGSGGSTFTINGDGSLSDISSQMGSYSLSDVKCVTALHNADLTGYTGGTDFPDPLDEGTGGIDAPPSDPCDWWDLVCVAQKIYLSVTSFFTTFPTLLGEIIGPIMAPLIESVTPGEDDSTVFSDAFENLKTDMTTKLGFLAYPFTWISDFWGNIFAISWTGGQPSCAYDTAGTNQWGDMCTLVVPGWQGQAFPAIRWGQMETSFPTIWTVTTAFARFAFFIGIIEMLRRSYMRTVTK